MSVMNIVQAINQIGTMAGWIDKDVSKKIENRTALLETNGSITRLLTATTIEPIVIVSENAYQSEKVEAAINLSLDLFSSYYMQAFKILTNLKGLETNEAIRVLSTKTGIVQGMKNVPKDLQSVKQTGTILANVMQKQWVKNYDKVEAAMNKFGMFKEDYVESLFDSRTGLLSGVIHTEAEVKDKEIYIHRDKTAYLTEKDSGGKNGISFEKFYIKELELNIDIKKEVSIDGKDPRIDTRKLILPITIKAVVIQSPIEAILSLLKPFSQDKSFASRWDDYKSGSISLMNLLFCGDLISEYKNDKLRTETELSKLLNSRVTQSTTKLATQGIRGYEANYNMLVLSSNDLPVINKYLRGDLFKEKFKEEVLEQAHAIAATILDDDYERMSLLVKDNYGVSTASYKRVSDKTTNQYDAIIEMLNALTAGRNLHF